MLQVHTCCCKWQNLILFWLSSTPLYLYTNSYKSQGCSLLASLKATLDLLVPSTWDSGNGPWSLGSRLCYTAAVPTLFDTRDGFCRRQIFHRVGVGRWFQGEIQDDSGALYLLCTLFLLLLHQRHLRSSGLRYQRLATPPILYSWMFQKSLWAPGYCSNSLKQVTLFPCIWPSRFLPTTICSSVFVAPHNSQEN